MPAYNNTQTVVETDVSSIETVALDVISCYQKKSVGLCYLIAYKGNTFTCKDLISLVNKMNPNVVMKNCDYTIKSGNYILIYSTGEYVYIQLQ
jgi:hypothetical protein